MRRAPGAMEWPILRAVVGRNFGNDISNYRLLLEDTLSHDDTIFIPSPTYSQSGGYSLRGNGVTVRGLYGLQRCIRQYGFERHYGRRWR